VSDPHVLVLGNANVDLVLGEIDGWPAVGTEIMVDRAETRPGGSAGNTALALAGMGVPHLFLATSGSDMNGDWLRAQFPTATTGWAVLDSPTTLTVGIVHKGGDRAFITTPGHLERTRADDLIARIPKAAADNGWAILSGTFLMPDLSDNGEALLDALTAKGWRTAIDPGWPPQGWAAATRQRMAGWMAKADASLINAEEARALAQLDDIERAVAMLANGPVRNRLLVVKRGPHGASAIRDGAYHHAPSPAVDVIDTVGAGDTFNAAFLAALTAGAAVGDALTRGAETAARAISTFPRSYR